MVALMRIIAFAIALLSLGLLADESLPPFELADAKPLPSFTAQFQQTDGWTGADAAYSIPLGRDRLLWVFADTWIGKIENGRRVGARMVNNTFAWQSLRNRSGPLRFFWRTDGDALTAVLRPDGKDAWYWPGDGAVIDGQLYLFCKVARRDDSKPEGFQFDWFGDDLLQIHNPMDEPTVWRFEQRTLPSGLNVPRMSGACLVEGDYLYAYGLLTTAKEKHLNRPLGVARIHRRHLKTMEMSRWEYWCGDRWSDNPEKTAALFRDAAPEMSVSRVRGLPGFVATYTSLGLSANILVRHAPLPEGPWSKPLRVYRCPEEKLMLYGAKAHAALAERDGQLIITYCRNTGSLKEHVERPEIYFPQGVEVRLRISR